MAVAIQNFYRKKRKYFLEFEITVRASRPLKGTNIFQKNGVLSLYTNQNCSYAPIHG
jgi:hypothetical protein